MKKYLLKVVAFNTLWMSMKEWLSWRAYHLCVNQSGSIRQPFSTSRANLLLKMSSIGMLPKPYYTFKNHKMQYDQWKAFFESEEYKQLQ